MPVFGKLEDLRQSLRISLWKFALMLKTQTHKALPISEACENCAYAGRLVMSDVVAGGGNEPEPSSEEEAVPKPTIARIFLPTLVRRVSEAAAELRPVTPPTAASCVQASERQVPGLTGQPRVSR